MKRAAILILFCAAALPAAVVAQTADQPLIGTKWKLKQPKQKVAGPAVPPPARTRMPRTAQPAKAPPRKARPNNAPIRAALARAKRH